MAGADVLGVGVGDAGVTEAEALAAELGVGIGLATVWGAGVGVAVKMFVGEGGFRPHHEYARITQRAAPQMRARLDCLIPEWSAIYAGL